MKCIPRGCPRGIFNLLQDITMIHNYSGFKLQYSISSSDYFIKDENSLFDGVDSFQIEIITGTHPVPSINLDLFISNYETIKKFINYYNKMLDVHNKASEYKINAYLFDKNFSLRRTNEQIAKEILLDVKFICLNLVGGFVYTIEHNDEIAKVSMRFDDYEEIRDVGRIPESLFIPV